MRGESNNHTSSQYLDELLLNPNPGVLETSVNRLKETQAQQERKSVKFNLVIDSSDSSDDEAANSPMVKGMMAVRPHRVLNFIKS